jgi:hypothetical protein
MTDPPQGRDRTPSVAALAVEVSALRRDVKEVTGRADTLTQTAQEHSVVLDGFGELRRQVERILALLTEDDQGAPTGWFWLTMDDQAREEKLGELTDWVNTVLRTQYPGYLTGQIRSCWPNHPEALWELTWLYQLWSHAYLAKRPAPKNAADWHDRWVTGVLRRLSTVMAECDGTCQSQPRLTTVRDPPATGRAV